MSYIKFEHRSLGHPRWLTTSPEAFTVHVYALDYCNEQATDGFIPDAVARRLVCPTDPTSIPAAFDVLVESGVWVRVEGGYQCPDFLAHGLAAEEQDRTRAKWAEDKRRQRLCRIGNHELCTARSKCHAGGRTSTNGQVETRPRVHRQTSGGLDPTRPDQTPSGVWYGERGGDIGLNADAWPYAPKKNEGNEAPATPWRPMGDCKHMPGGRDVHTARPDLIRCRDCRTADRVEVRRRAVAEARAELDRQGGESV